MAAACAADVIILATSRGYLLRYQWDEYGNEKGTCSRKLYATQAGYSISSSISSSIRVLAQAMLPSQHLLLQYSQHPDGLAAVLSSIVLHYACCDHPIQPPQTHAVTFLHPATTSRPCSHRNRADAAGRQQSAKPLPRPHRYPQHRMPQNSQQYRGAVRSQQLE